MSFRKMVTYSTAMTLTCTTSLFVDAQINQVSAVSNQCLTTVYEVTKELNKGPQGAGYDVFFPTHDSTGSEKGVIQWVNAPDGNVISFSHNNIVTNKYMKNVSTKIINSCKNTVAVSFSSCAGECAYTYGVVKGKIVEFKYSGCHYDNSIVNGAFNRYGKINWGYEYSYCTP